MSQNLKFGTQEDLAEILAAQGECSQDFRKAEFEISFGEGISHVGEVVDLGVELDIIKKSGSWFSYNDSKIGQGRDAVKKLLADNPELSEEIEAKIMDAIRSKHEA
jgi:recombination protein RecA